MCTDSLFYYLRNSSFFFYISYAKHSLRIKFKKLVIVFMRPHSAMAEKGEKDSPPGDVQLEPESSSCSSSSVLKQIKDLLDVYIFQISLQPSDAEVESSGSEIESSQRDSDSSSISNANRLNVQQALELLEQYLESDELDSVIRSDKSTLREILQQLRNITTRSSSFMYPAVTDLSKAETVFFEQPESTQAFLGNLIEKTRMLVDALLSASAADTHSPSYSENK